MNKPWQYQTNCPVLYHATVSNCPFSFICCRFRCIVYPLQPKPTVFVAKAAIVLIWVLAVLIMCPAAVALTVEKVPFHYMVSSDNPNHTLPLYTCYENFAKPHMRKVYTAVLFVHIYLLPLTIITLMYGSIGVKLLSSVIANRERQLANAVVQVGGRRGGQPKINQKKIKVIKMLILVALLFMLSWLPLWTLMMMADYAGLDRDQVDLLTSYIFPFAHWLAFANSSVNPIIYGYYNENFKRGFQAVCKSWRRVGRGPKKERAVQPAGGEAPFGGGGTVNHNGLVLALRNRVHNDNNAALGCVAAQKEKHSGEQSVRVSSLAPSVNQAWDN